jgi:LPS export ABC transporter protein LptC
MRRLKKIFFLLLLLGIFVELIIIVPQKIQNHRGSRLSEVAKKINEESGKSFGQGIHIVESQKGQRDFELFAESAEGQQGVGTWNLFKIRVNYYNKQTVDYTVTGEKGFVDGRTKDMDIVGKVKTVSKNGYEFITSSIHYKAFDRLITSPDQVAMRGPRDKDGEGLRLTGKQMSVDVEKNRMLIKNEIRAEKEISKGDKAVIHSQEAEFSGVHQKALFRGNVRMSYKKMTIEAPEAAFDYTEGSDFLSSVQFRGGVKFSDQDKKAVSQQMKLNLRAQEIVLDGNPQVIQDQDELRGERITFLEGGKKVKVEKVKAQMNPDPK